MKFKFPLESVLNFRKTLENMAQRDLQEAMAELHQQNEKLNFLLSQIVEARENAFQSQVEGGKASPHLVQIEEFIRGQDVRTERQRTKIKDCEQKVEECREILRQKAIDYKIIEGLRDRRKEEFKKNVNRIEQKLADDQTTMRHRTGEE